MRTVVFGFGVGSGSVAAKRIECRNLEGGGRVLRREVLLMAQLECCGWAAGVCGCGSPWGCYRCLTVLARRQGRSRVRMKLVSPIDLW
jgi:hypothetical protein